jgi:hypothetical protein
MKPPVIASAPTGLGAILCGVAGGVILIGHQIGNGIRDADARDRVHRA